MRKPWLDILDHVLRPARLHLEGCLKERERHLDARRIAEAERARAIAMCERRINDARAAVLATNDGVVTSRMTDLEREWRRLSRPDPDAGLMDLWARTAPASWIDCKRWQGSDPAARLDAAIALAADVDGVEAAEAAIDALREALAAHGTAIGARIRWRHFAREGARDAACAAPLLTEPLRTASDAVPAAHETAIFGRARRVERSVHEAALARFAERPSLAADLANAAFVDCVWRAVSLAGLPNPVDALKALWSTGYVLSEAGAGGVVLEIPPLGPSVT